MPGPGDKDSGHDPDDLVGFSSQRSLQGERRAAAAEPSPAPRRSTLVQPSPFEPSAEFAAFEARRRAQPREPDETPGVVGLYVIYALILFTVPTVGVAGVVALLAMWKRPEPPNALARSHFVFQRRTLMAGVIAAVVGVVLMAAPYALGVPILFLTALWLILRGAWGVWALKAGRAISHPRGWWI